MDADGEAEIRGQTLRDRTPRMTAVVAAQHADVGPWSAWSGPLRPAAVILHIKAAWRGVVARDLVHALAEFWIRIRIEPGADAGVRRIERRAAVFAQVVSPCRNAEMHSLAVADDRV